MMEFLLALIQTSAGTWLGAGVAITMVAIPVCVACSFEHKRDHELKLIAARNLGKKE